MPTGQPRWSVRSTMIASSLAHAKDVFLIDILVQVVRGHGRSQEDFGFHVLFIVMAKRTMDKL